QILALVAIEPCGGLIEHQNRRLERERARETDELLDAEGKSGDARVTVAFELDEFDDALDGCAVAHLLAAHSPEEQHLGQGIGADACVPPGQEVVEHRHLRKQLAVLERACESEPSNLVPRAAGDKVATKTDLPLAAVDTAHAIEHAGLAGAVRTDQREQ